jgi:hypothetical protein
MEVRDIILVRDGDSDIFTALDWIGAGVVVHDSPSITSLHKKNFARSGPPTRHRRLARHDQGRIGIGANQVGSASRQGPSESGVSPVIEASCHFPNP